MTKVNQTIVYVRRVWPALLLAILFGLGGRFAAKKLFADRQLLEERFQYRLEYDGPDPAEMWRDFAGGQRQSLKQLARQKLPLLGEKLEIESVDDIPILYLRLQCPGNMPVTERFRELTDLYRQQFPMIISSSTESSGQTQLLAELEPSGCRFSKTFTAGNRQLAILIIASAIAGYLLGVVLFSPGVATPNIRDTSPKKTTARPIASPKKSPEQTAGPVIEVLATIDTERDQPAMASFGNASAGRSNYDIVAERLEQWSKKVGTSPAIILVGSPESKYAQLPFTVNTAISLARRGERVLLVGADPGRGELAEMFGIPAEPGFYQWRSGAAWISQTTHATGISGMSIMPPGTASDQQIQEGLDLAKERHRWGNLATHFDIVLLHSEAALSLSADGESSVYASHLRQFSKGALALIGGKQREIDQQNHDLERLLASCDNELIGRIRLI